MMHNACQKAPRSSLLTRYLFLHKLLYKPSNILWNARLDGIGHLINPLFSYNRILPQLARDFCSISVKVDTTRNINTDRFFFLTTGRSNSSSSSSSTF